MIITDMIKNNIQIRNKYQKTIMLTRIDIVTLYIMMLCFTFVSFKFLTYITTLYQKIILTETNRQLIMILIFMRKETVYNALFFSPSILTCYESLAIPKKVFQKHSVEFSIGFKIKVYKVHISGLSTWHICMR